MVHRQVTVILPTCPSPWLAPVQLLHWQEVAVAAYRQTEQTDRDRRNELASRILELTGQPIEVGAIFVDSSTRTATVAIEDVVFQLRHAELFLVRPCVHCGTGHFRSATIDCVADLGHALAVWEPRCPGCIPDDEEEDRSYSF